MTKVAAPNLATYEEGYNTFGLPYIFDDKKISTMLWTLTKCRIFFFPQRTRVLLP